MPEKTNREHCNAIYLRSGKELIEKPTKEANLKEKEVEIVDESEVNEGFISEEKEPREKEVTPPSKPVVKPFVPPLPYPNRLKAHKDEEQYKKFLDIFKKLHINIPFAEALAQMPTYLKFMKDILSKKRKIEDQATIALTEECSAIIQNKLPPKLKDPGSFSIPIQIGSLCFNKVLCDLGASINLMPLSIFRKLGLGEVKPTYMTLKLADRSIIYPWGVVEDVLIKAGKFYFPVDFVVIDIDEDEEVPLILGRSFLATSRALIDMEEGEMTLRVGAEKEVFKMFERRGRDEEGKAGNRKCGRVESANTEPS